MGPVGGRRTGVITPIGPKTIGRVVGTFKPYTSFVIGISTAVLLSSALSSLPPFFLREIVNNGLIKHSLIVVTHYTVLALIVTCASTLLSMLYSYLSVLVGQRIMRDLRNSLYTHLQGMALKWFTSTKTGEIQSRLANDIGGVQSVVSDTAATFLNNIVTVLSSLGGMIYLDWRLTLLSVGILPIFALVGAKVGSVARTVRGATQKNLAEMSATMA